MKKFWTKEVKIALAVIMSLVVLYAGIQFLKGVNVLKPANHYYVTFSNVQDLMISSPVTVDGFKVGLVHEMDYSYQPDGKITVMLNLDKELNIPKGSKIALSHSLLGGAAVAIELNPYVSEYYESGDMIEGVVEADLMSSVSGMVPQITALMPKLDSILVGIQTLVNDPALAVAVKRIDGITADLESSVKSLDKVMKNDVPTLLNNVNAVVYNIDTLATTINAMPLASTMQSVDSIAYNLAVTTTQLNSTNNTLGLLLNDRYIYDRLTGTVSSLDSLLIDLRMNPKRYVHFSLF